MKQNSLYTARTLLSVALISFSYLIISWLLIGFKEDQIILVLLFNACMFYSWRTRKLILGFSIFIFYWILYDYMKAFPNYLFNEVHIQDLYKLERHIFPIVSGNHVLTPNEYFALHSVCWIDIMCGVFYLLWIPLPLGFASYLLIKKPQYFIDFALTFLWVNILGFLIYYLYPAAPPWYKNQYGSVFMPSTPGNTAGLARFDAYFDISIFKSIYSKGSNVFAAMPSLHSAYPLIVLYYGLKMKMGYINTFFAIVSLGIWFAAVYTNHHYVLDVIGGIFTAMVGIATYNYFKSIPFIHAQLMKFLRVLI